MPKEQAMKNISFKVDPALHEEFRVWCVKGGVKAKAALPEIIRRAIQKPCRAVKP